MLELFKNGGPIMWPLLLLSFVSTAFIIERALFFWNESLCRRPRYVNAILKATERGRLARAENLARRSRQDFVVRTLLNGLAHRHYSLTQALETQALIEIRRMKKYLGVLDTAITAAPLLGILGTVVGIIFSFEALGTLGVADPTAVTQGISQALITTAFGLIISLFTLLPFNFYQSYCQKATEELERFSTILEIIMQKGSAEFSPSHSFGKSHLNLSGDNPQTVRL